MDRDMLIRGHMSLAGRLAREHRGRGVQLEDLESEANLALVRAAGDYDPATHPEVTFAAFACRYIKLSLREAIERCDVVRLPRQLKRAVMRVNASREALFARGISRPTIAEIAEASGLGAELVEEALAFSESETPIESFGSFDQADPDQTRRLELVEEVLDRCGETGRKLIVLVWFDGLTIAQAARRMVISIREATRQHDEASLLVEDAFRRRGWNSKTWAAAIA